MNTELHNGPVREDFIVRSLHVDNPTLSPWEILIQWPKELLRREICQAVVGDQDHVSRPCSRVLHNTCCHQFHNQCIYKSFPLVLPGVSIQKH